MDKSEEYIKMCEKAVEIQKLRKNKLIIGDYYDLVVLEGDAIYIVDREYIDKKCLPWCQYSIWLPRQDQLQEVMWLSQRESCEKATDGELQGWYFDLMKEVFEVYEWYYNEEYDYNHFTSMEQLWLAFVMKEKYKKIWNGEDWNKESNEQ